MRPFHLVRYLSSSLLALCAACGVPGEDTGFEPSPYIYEDDQLSPPDIDLDAVATSIEQAAATVRSLNALPVWDAYLAAVATADAYCPAEYTGPDATYWFDQCTDDAGTTYEGYGYVIAYDDQPQGQYIASARALFSVASIDTGEGERFEAGGSVVWLEGDATGELYHRLFQSQVNGTFTWTGPEADGTWMQSALVPDLQMTAAWVPDNGAGQTAQVIYVEGALAGMEGAHSAMSFEGVRLATQSLGSQCALEPSGVISVRTDDGSWVDVLFDGPTDENPSVVPGSCDGCGVATWRGEVIGEACADFSGLLDWTEAPW